MSSSNQKEVGDHVKISAGANKEKEGILQEKVRKGWNIKLQSGEVVLAAFPFIKLLAKAGESEESLQSEEPQDSEALPETEPENRVTEIIEDANDNPSPASEETGEETSDESEHAEQLPADASATQGVNEEIEIPDDIKKMTVAQLRDLAKQKGVSVARTKDDFLRIIKSMNSEEDLERLRGKVLFDRVSELHISRLRSKEDLQILLAQ